MALTKDQIVEQITVLLAALKKQHDIKEAYLFGSYATGQVKEESDVDIAVVLGSYENGGPFDERFEIFHQMQ